MIVGIGTDIVEIERISAVLQRHGDRFTSYILTDREAEEADRRGDRIPFVAGRWAAKEAVAKALGTGFSEGVTLRGIVVVKTPSGAPQVELDAPSKKIMDSLGGKKIFLSLTHTKDYAQAFAIITG